MTGRDSQGAYRQDEMIGGKPSAVKQICLCLWVWLKSERERGRENEDGASLRQSCIVICRNSLWVRVIVKQGVNKSSHPIQNPLLLVTEPRTRDSTLASLEL
jgi:hypothetical protein